MGSRWFSVVVDAIDPGRLGRWWAEVLDYRIDYEAADEVIIVSSGNGHPAIVFVAVPEAKHAPNRLHIDLDPDDRDGVGRLVRIAVDEGRAARPELSIGVCGEHGGDPDSVGFFHEAGLDYVSCSPFRVPVARLEAGRAAVDKPVDHQSTK